MTGPRLLFSLSCLLALTASSAQDLHSIRDLNGVWVMEGKDSVLYYRSATQSQNGNFPRAHYIHPLFGPEGQVITEDFPADHPHHRGVFWAWHQVWVGEKRMGDAWECRDFQWDVKATKTMDADTCLTLRSTVHWKSPKLLDNSGDPVPFVEENSDIRVFPEQQGVRIIDFEITLKALVPGVRLGGSEDAKGYGGFSVRMKMPENPEFRSVSGRVQPRENALHAGNWIQISPLPGGTGSLVMISGNSAGGRDVPWILRKKESMQNAVFPGREPIALEPDRPVRLRYQLLICKGNLPPGKIRSLKE